MLRDQDYALDFLFGVKTSILDLTRAAVEAENPRLKQMLIQMRNKAEQSHEEIYKITERINAYLPAAPADNQHLQRVGQFFQQNQQDLLINTAETHQYASTYQGSYYGSNYGTNTGSEQYQNRTAYYENINPLQSQGSQYYRYK
jgi:hypothetical protein